MKIKDLKGIAYSQLGGFIQFVKLFDWNDGHEICNPTIEYVLSKYPKAEVTRLLAQGDELYIYIKEEK